MQIRSSFFSVCVFFFFFFFFQNFAERGITAISKARKNCLERFIMKKEQNKYAVGPWTQCLMYVKVHQGTYLAPWTARRSILA